MSSMRYTADDRGDQRSKNGGSRADAAAGPFPIANEPKGSDRRTFRRHDMEQQSVPVERFDGRRSEKLTFGQIVDLSAGGVRIRTADGSHIKPDHQIRVRLELPAYAGISPFIDTTGGQAQPKREWVGWMTVARVTRIGERYDVAGRLVDMDEMDRGMLGLYLSTQPLAA